MVPRKGDHTPMITRASEVLPEPLGPITPMASPALRRNWTLVRIGVWPPGGPTVAAPSRLCDGLGRMVVAFGRGSHDRTPDRRRVASRAPMKPRQLAIAVSAAAGARLIVMEDAIIAAAVRYGT